MILGKLPPPWMGPAIATRIILDSALKDRFQLIHLDTTINREIATMGRWNLGKSFRSLGLYFKMFGKLLGKRPQMVLIPISQTTMGFMKDAIYIWLARICFRKVVVQLRGSNWRNWLSSTGGFTRWFVRFTLKGTSGVIVLGENLRYLFDDIYPEHKIFVVPNGSDYDLPEHASQDGPVRLLYLANFLPTKGFDHILKALTKVQTESPYELHALGAWDNPDYEAECKSIAEEHQLPVVFHGPAGGVKKWQQLATADAFIFTPRAPEGHPWVIVEALAAKLPIIATDQGAIIESVIHEKNGFIVPVDEEAPLAEAIAKLLNSSELRTTMGKAGHAHYRAHFTEAKLVENLSRTFNAIINPQ